MKAAKPGSQVSLRFESLKPAMRLSIIKEPNSKKERHTLFDFGPARMSKAKGVTPPKKYGKMREVMQKVVLQKTAEPLNMRGTSQKGAAVSRPHK